MIKLSNIFDNIEEFKERVKSSNIWNEDKQFILNILETPYKLSNIKNWKDLYNVLLNGFTKNSRDYVSLFDYTEDELNFIYEYVNQSESERINFIKLSISKILKSNEFQKFIKSLDKKYDFKLIEEKEEKRGESFIYGFVNNFKIYEYHVHSDYYLSSKSNLRNLRKVAKDLNYYPDNVIKLFENIFNVQELPKDIQDYIRYDIFSNRNKLLRHNTGISSYTGPLKPSKQSIIEKLQQIYYEYTK